MRILFCDNSLRELINFREDVILHYKNLNHETILVSPENATLPVALNGVRFIPIKMSRSGMNPLKDLKYFFELIKIYKREKPTYIFHYTIKPNIYGSLAAAILKIPSTAMIAGLGYVFTGHNFGCRIARVLYRFAMRFPEKIFVLNQYNKDVIISKKIAEKDKIILLTGGEGVNLGKFNI